MRSSSIKNLCLLFLGFVGMAFHADAAGITLSFSAVNIPGGGSPEGINDLGQIVGERTINTVTVHVVSVAAGSEKAQQSDDDGSARPQ